MHRPLLLVGDGPNEHTGLGRLARDLGAIIRQSDLPVDLVQVGGPVLPTWNGWPHVPMTIADRGEDWGCAFVEAVWRDRWGSEPGVLWLVGWDPARVFAYAHVDLNVQLWSYPAIDTHNVGGGLSGPPAEGLHACTRVLAYGRWAAGVVKSVRDEPIGYLPHGLDLDTFAVPATAEEHAWSRAQLGPHVGDALVVGCVATNQARKDLALYCETLAVLKARGQNVYGWLHTDMVTSGAWSVSQLVNDFGLQHRITVTIGALTDRQLACLYQRCDVTIAPGLGEGFGYPIVESLAAGVPVVHGDFAGGSELVPKSEWRVPVRAVRRESIYALTRPVFRAEDVANAVERALRWVDTVDQVAAAAYCQGAVAHLDWSALQGRWLAWIRKGLA